VVTREILALLSQVRILIGQHFLCFMTHSRIINKDLIVAIYKRDIKTLQQYLEKEHKDIVVMELCDYYEFWRVP
jgi:protein-tyrosine-phosphatase